MKHSIMLGVFILLLSMVVGVASAQETRINIDMSETVYQNVTFAEDFNLVENQKYCTLIGIVNVSNPSADPVADINLTFTNTDNMNSNFTYVSGRAGSQVMGNSTIPYVIHIVELRGGDYSMFNYSVDCSSVEPPLDIETNYSNLETGINRKVLAGHNWTITQNASNQLAIGVPINSINVLIRAKNVSWNGTDDDFKLVNLQTVGDWSNVVGNGTSNETWTWNVNGGTLTPNAWNYITYKVKAPENVPTSDSYLAIEEELSYSITYLASNLSLTDVTAVGDVDMELDKRIVQPADNENNTNATWEVNADITVPFNISYDLTKVSLWVTTTLDPSDTNIPIFGYLNDTQTPGSEINQSAPWAATAWQFNYTDASNNASARPPIVWIRPYFTVMNAYNQIVNSSITQNGNDYYLKYIYVVNGYWLQIDKNITNIAADQYRIETLVENIGNAWTPNGLVVTVYDFVPAEFAPWNWSTGYDSNSTVTGAGYNGSSYRWTIPLKSPRNSSLGPSTETYLNRTWNVSYNVNGSGDYRVSELYIVGLDPRKVDGAGTHEGITVKSAFSSASTEVIYIMVVVFLVIINIVNFVMTRRINQKLNNHHK